MNRLAAAERRPGPPARRMFEKGKRLSRKRQFEQAIAAYRGALALEPGYADALNGLGVALDGLGRTRAAVAAYRRALKYDPRHAKAHNNIGTVHLVRNRLVPAIAAYKRALELNRSIPKIRYNLGIAQLLGGDLVSGFRNYESRWAVRKPRSGRSPSNAWRGERSLRGRSILLHTEQGFGDMIHFARFVPLVASLGAKVHLEVARPLLRLFRASFPQIESVHVAGAPLPKCDENCPMASLPLAFGIDASKIPARIPYLKTPVRWRRSAIGRTPGVPRIGIAWSGGLELDDDRNRSIPFERFREIFLGSRSRLASLQKEVRASDRAALAAMPAVANFEGRLFDFADTAALIDGLDLVVSVDTSVAHLAGALGKPVWLLLPFAPDWRWMLNRSDSAWYPSMRLFRQPRVGDWDSVFAAVRSELMARFPLAKSEGDRPHAVQRL
jgi:hypothetical protein